ncbi:hypothetical protein CPU12_01200 [Malaciobacter molluscorum LMG 25693]|uniref:Type IV secretion system protein n=2 Tax=Arcobacteraceae TaxID=2808963 RepID=A0A2G1DM19_9BACT|nr:hypothetical protein [Malaciobacter molluscorum]AXX92195.1 hypothetical protein AMOL_1214 [Malaciobacter molluscorum LMG 25693]PHO19424.1 hypothetical protein CPU12_01200 [Malaciobacter molluscorum LMG 25693]
MKTSIKILLILTLSYNNCFALFGAGDVVSDPTSYTYYAKQIKAFNDQIKTALDQLEVLNKANDLIDKTNDLIFKSGEKIYNPTKKLQNLVSNIQGIKDRFQSMAERAKNMGAERFFKDYHNVSEPLNNKAYEKWKDNLAALFDNSQDETYQNLRKKILSAQKNNNYVQYQKAVNNMSTYLELKKKEQEGLKKASLRAPIDLYQEYFLNEERVKEKELRRKNISDLMMQIGSADDVLKQQQITNQLLLYMLETIDKQYEMQMRYYYALTIPKFQNHSTSIDEELTKLKEEREKYRTSRNIHKKDSIKERDKYIKSLQEEGEQSDIYKILAGEQDFYDD